MSIHVRPWPAAAKQRLAVRRFWLRAALAASALLIQGCATSPPQPFSGVSPADADRRAAAVGYQPVLGDYVSRRPVDPSPWIERNRQVAPPQKGSE